MNDADLVYVVTKAELEHSPCIMLIGRGTELPIRLVLELFVVSGGVDLNELETENAPATKADIQSLMAYCDPDVNTMHREVRGVQGDINYMKVNTRISKGDIEFKIQHC